MSLSSIDVAPDVVGTVIPQTVRPVAVQTVDGKDYQQMVMGIAPVPHDYIQLGYTGTNLTSVIYKVGGSGGTTVKTLTLAYSGSTLTSVTAT